MRGFVTRLLVLLACALPAVDAAHAHRMDAALSVVEVNPRTGQLEITHTLFAHDLEGALLAGAVSVDWLESAPGQQALRAYCLRQFTIQNERGRPLQLTFVGAELQSDKINIFFEAPRYRGRALLIDSNLLQDISERQVNQVNLRARGQTNTATFAVGAEAKRMVLP